MVVLFCLCYNLLYSELLAECVYRCLYLCCILQFVGYERKLCLAIVWRALFKLLNNESFQFVIILVLYQWSLAACNAKSYKKPLNRYIKVDCCTLCVHVFDIVKEAWGSSTSGYDNILKLSNLVQHPALDIAESLFALLGKQLRNGLAETLLYVVVEVNEW